MATTPTTTLRVPCDLRDLIAQLATERDSSMAEVVSDAVAALRRQQWWGELHDQLDQISDADAADYHDEVGRLDTAGDGLR